MFAAVTDVEEIGTSSPLPPRLLAITPPAGSTSARMKAGIPTSSTRDFQVGRLAEMARGRRGFVTRTRQATSWPG
ncbi:hypothetical protein [Caldinitratiruptor microaerophilus]|uniref:hypothetical protein n=1 Tax=Caldinitratiruptor microaerophilus TaxID=671077 RepID=UPI0022304C25|nr:hypothetical protein [Caldinitratiruptor microaerophilus]